MRIFYFILVFFILICILISISGCETIEEVEDKEGKFTIYEVEEEPKTSANITIPLERPSFLDKMEE